MATGDVYQVKVSQQPPNIGDEALNVFFYQQVSGTAPLSDFIDQFNDDVLVEMRLVQVDTCFYNYVEVTSLFDPADFERLDWDTGTVHGDLNVPASPPSTAVNFTLQRSSRLVRNGSKRLTGFPNNLTDNGKITDGFTLGILNNIANAFAADITYGDDDSVMSPVIVKRIKTANPDYPDNSKYPFIYSLPDNAGDTISPRVKSSKFSPFLSTQVSRKTNR